MSQPPLALTMGDPAGIGPELALLAWLRRRERRLPVFFLLACPVLMADRARKLGLDVPLQELSHPSEADPVFDAALPVLARMHTGAVEPGSPRADLAPAILASIETAVELVLSGVAAAIVTNPIAKSVLYTAGFPHPGHTEFLEALARRHGSTSARSVMMLACDALRVVPLTVHIPLSAVAGAVTKPLILETARIVTTALQQDFALPQARLAVAGLNPHAGEMGALGDEEVRIIAPAIEELRAEGLAITGPHSADTLFHAAARSRYDAVIAMYHDQALVPLKTLAFDEGVNVTLGLPFVRTSPDHGTAFDIAGRGSASPESLMQALLLARRLADNRGRASSSPGRAPAP